MFAQNMNDKRSEMLRIVFDRLAEAEDKWTPSENPLDLELWEAVSEFDAEEVKRIIAEGGKSLNLNFKGPETTTPLGHASLTNQLSIVRMLLEAGASVNERDVGCYKETPLHYAVHHSKRSAPSGSQSRCRDIVKLLLEWGANPHLVDCAGNTPLSIVNQTTVALSLSLSLSLTHTHTHTHTHTCVQLLLEWGANPHLMDWAGITPLSIANKAAKDLDPQVVEMVRAAAEGPLLSDWVRRRDYACGGCGAVAAGVGGGAGGGGGAKVVPKLLLCQGCGLFRYCSIECQKEDWPKHKQLCKQAKELRVSAKLAADVTADTTERGGAATCLVTFRDLTARIKAVRMLVDALRSDTVNDSEKLVMTGIVPSTIISLHCLLKLTIEPIEKDGRDVFYLTERTYELARQFVDAGGPAVVLARISQPGVPPHIVLYGMQLLNGIFMGPDVKVSWPVSVELVQRLQSRGGLSELLATLVPFLNHTLWHYPAANACGVFAHFVTAEVAAAYSINTCATPSAAAPASSPHTAPEPPATTAAAATTTTTTTTATTAITATTAATATSTSTAITATAATTCAAADPPPPPLLNGLPVAVVEALVAVDWDLLARAANVGERRPPGKDVGALQEAIELFARLPQAVPGLLEWWLSQPALSKTIVEVMVTCVIAGEDEEQWCLGLHFLAHALRTIPGFATRHLVPVLRAWPSSCGCDPGCDIRCQRFLWSAIVRRVRVDDFNAAPPKSSTLWNLSFLETDNYGNAAEILTALASPELSWCISDFPPGVLERLRHPLFESMLHIAVESKDVRVKRAMDVVFEAAGLPLPSVTL